VVTLDAPPGSRPAEAWSRLQQRLEALSRRGFTQADLDQARAAWLARRCVESLDPEAEMASALADALGRGVSLERMRALTLEDLNAGLRRWLDPTHRHGGLLGDPEPAVAP
jgi:hypothetical protein